MNAEMADPKEVFLDALECQSAEELTRFLDEACAGETAVRARVESLLRAHRQAGHFLNGATGDDWISEGVGSIIGPYTLLAQIGEGGMGVVFKAQQTEPIHRTVALKIIKPGMDSRQVLARFSAEQQALALMDHPNIARVLDAGTTETGRPYFVMELVEGAAITDYCDQKNFSVRERLELMAAVCQSVQHAHQKGVIHRDIKPTNVLVAESDGKAVPKVIDFGVAKAIAQGQLERTSFTQSGQIIGTFEYMSPEQARFNEADIDIRTDIYSLGVLLYELLAGSTPIEKQRLRSGAFDEILRIIREEEPPRPSERLDSSESLPSIAARRHMEPARLSRLMRGELDWIVMKALEKDRNRRYEAASALAADILHYLSDEPVSAAAPSRLYRASKFVRRNKVAVIASAAVLAGLVAGIIGMTIGLVSQSRQRVIAERERAEAQLNLATALQSQSKYPEAEELFRRGLEIPAGDTTQDRQRTARTLFGLAQVVGGDAESERLYREALSTYRTAFPPGDPNIAHALTTLGDFLRRRRRDAEAEPLFREAYEIQHQAVPADHYARGVSSAHLGALLSALGRHGDAEPFLRESIAEYRRATPQNELSIAVAQLELGRSYYALARFPEAEAQLLEAVRTLGPTSSVYYGEIALAGMYAAWDKAEPGRGYDARAEEWFRKIIDKYYHWEPAATDGKQPSHIGEQKRL